MAAMATMGAGGASDLVSTVFASACQEIFVVSGQATAACNPVVL